MKPKHLAYIYYDTFLAAKEVLDLPAFDELVWNEEAAPPWVLLDVNLN